MRYLYQQELFKLSKRPSTWVFLGLLCLQNLVMAWLGQRYAQYTIPQENFAFNYGSTSFVVFILITACSATIATEFEYNTIKNLVSQAYSRQVILTSKWLAMLTYSVGLYLVAMGMTLVSKLIWVGNAFQLTTTVHGGQPLWQHWVLATGTYFVTLWLLLSIVFLVAAMFKKGNIAMLVGIGGYFALSILGKFQVLAIHKWDVVKWNPLNFLNYPEQATAVFSSRLTHLTTTELLAGNLVYTALFLGLGLYFFSRKEV